MNIYERIERARLSDGEDRIRKLILCEPEEFISSGIPEISDTCSVSRATLYRFCTDVGTDGIADLKWHLSADLSEWKNRDQAFDYDYPFHNGDSIQTIAETLKKDYGETVQATKILMEPQEFRHAAEKMEQCSCIDIYTAAGNLFFAQNFAFQMKEIGRDVNVPAELYDQLLHAGASDENHYAILISFGGRNMQMEKLCRILKKNGTEILLICSEQAEKLFPYSDHRLYMCSYESHADKISSYSTRLSLLYILDVLYTTYFQRHYRDNIRKKKTVLSEHA